MNYKDLMLSVIRGEEPKKIPFVPRLDIWYKSNKILGTLPSKYQNAKLTDIVDDLGTGYHAAVPDFRDYAHEDCDIDIGIGIYRFRTIPYEVKLHNIKRIVTREQEGLLNVEYITPFGNIKTGVVYDESSKKSGSTLSSTVEYAVKSARDFKAAGYIFENMEITPKYEGYLEYAQSIGDKGLVTAFSSPYASPMHYIQKELMSFETFVYENYDYPTEMNSFAESVSKAYYKICDILSECPAEVILSGANYDSSVTDPEFFKKHIVPSLKKQSETLHKKGKYLLTHTDGENHGLLELFLESGFDIADSICPAPMTSLSLKEIRKVFNNKITIWGGIPSVCMLEEIMSDYDFEKFLDELLNTVADKKRIILNISDTTPPRAKFERLLRIIQKIEEQ